MGFPFKFFSGTSQGEFSVGLDIGAGSIKAVKLKSSKSGFEFSSFKLMPTALDLTAQLKELAGFLQTNKVNLSISGSASIIRYVNFPKMTSVELKQALKFEAQKYIPFTVSEVILDSYILKDNLPENKMLVLLAAAKKDFIEQRLKQIFEANLKVNLIDIDSLALVNAFNFNYAADSVKPGESSTLALLNIGAATSNLNILEDDIPRLSRDIHIAGNNFTQKISEALGIDFKQAEELKCNPDPDKLNKIAAAVEAVLSNLAQEIRTSFDYYETQTAASVTKIYLSGAGSLFSGIKDKLANLLGIEITYWDPLKKIATLDNVASRDAKQSLNQLAVAVGLAIRQ